MEKDIKNWEAITEGITYAQRNIKRKKRKGVKEEIFEAIVAKI